MNLNELTIAEARKGLDTKKFSSVELTQASLDHIYERKDLNAFVTITDEVAKVEAKIADKRITKKESGALTGIPFSVKDVICTIDVRSTASAKILDNYIPPYEATVIKKIRKQGAVLVGKTNCDAFGHGASNENSMYGPVKNPYDETKVSGGSSGGSAVSVADHQAIFSIAEDTGGSIRQPSAFCGVAGFRPSYGRNSRYGIMPMASSLDVVGPIAKTVEDIALLMEVIAGHDTKDSTSVPDAVPQYSKNLNTSVKGMKVGIPKEYMELEGIDEETRKIIEEKIQSCKELGMEIIEISLPLTKYAIPVYYIVVSSEDSSNLGRIDAIRYGVQVDGTSLINVYANSREQGFPEEVKRRIMIGTYALSDGYYDAYYRKAQKVRTLIRQEFDEAFTGVDVILTPTSPFPAFNFGTKTDDILAMYLTDVFVSPAAVAGIPALSIPAGKTQSGLPVGLQILGPRLAEERVLQVGYSIEKTF